MTSVEVLVLQNRHRLRSELGNICTFARATFSERSECVNKGSAGLRRF